MDTHFAKYNEAKKCFEPEAVLHHPNRGFLYGDGFFETLLIHNGMPTFWPYREIRIGRSYEFLRFDRTIVASELQSALITFLQTNGIDEARARLTFYRDGGGTYLPEMNTSSVFLAITQLHESPFNAHPAKTCAQANTKLPNDRSGNFKLIGKHYQVLAAIEARDKGVEELIFLNTNGLVCESISGNLFVVHDNKAFTPPLSSGCLAGTIRQTMIDAGATERPITIEEVGEADLVFTTNSIWGVTALDFDGKPDDNRLAHYKKIAAEAKLSSVRGLRGNWP